MEITVRELFAMQTIYPKTNSWGYHLNIDSKSNFLQNLIYFIENQSDKNNLNFDLGAMSFERDEKGFRLLNSNDEDHLLTILILISVLISRLKEIRKLSVFELEIYEDMLKRNVTYKFHTIPSDNLFFHKVIIDRCEETIDCLTETSVRIKKIFEIFSEMIFNKSERDIEEILKGVVNATLILNCTTSVEFRYQTIENCILLSLLKEKEIANNLAYMVDFKEHKNLNTIAHDFYIEISNDEIVMAVILFSGFEKEDYELIKDRKNLHYISFSEVICTMFEFENLPIKIIDKTALAFSVIFRSKNIDLSNIGMLIKN